MNRRKGKCPECGRIITIKIGVGPYADGRGDVMNHRFKAGSFGWKSAWCLGGKAIELPDLPAQSKTKEAA